MIDTSRPWSLLCAVEVEALRAWSDLVAWPAPSTPTKPQRVRDVPITLVKPIIEVVLPLLAGDDLYADGICVSRVMPGQSHPLHVDTQRVDWVTRVHVPLVTNPDAWFAWEEEKYDVTFEDGEEYPGEPIRVHFEAGMAYSFNTLKRHSFANDGATGRVHLLFDVRRR